MICGLFSSLSSRICPGVHGHVVVPFRSPAETAYSGRPVLGAFRPVADVEAVVRDTDGAVPTPGDRVAGVRQHVVSDDLEILDLGQLVERLAQGADDWPRRVL